MGPAAAVGFGSMQQAPDCRLQELLVAYGFAEWGVRLDGRRLRCPHGLLIGLAEECPVGCVSPLVVLGIRELARLPAVDS